MTHALKASREMMLQTDVNKENKSPSKEEKNGEDHSSSSNVNDDSSRAALTRVRRKSPPVLPLITLKSPPLSPAAEEFHLPPHPTFITTSHFLSTISSLSLQMLRHNITLQIPSHMAIKLQKQYNIAVSSSASQIFIANNTAIDSIRRSRHNLLFTHVP